MSSLYREKSDQGTSERKPSFYQNVWRTHIDIKLTIFACTGKQFEVKKYKYRSYLDVFVIFKISEDKKKNGSEINSFIASQFYRIQMHIMNIKIVQFSNPLKNIKKNEHNLYILSHRPGQTRPS